MPLVRKRMETKTPHLAPLTIAKTLIKISSLDSVAIVLNFDDETNYNM